MTLSLILAMALQSSAPGYSPEIEAVLNRPKRTGDAPAMTVDKSTPRQDFGVPTEIKARFETCLDTAIADPEAGIRYASAWQMDGGTFYARQCLGFAYGQAERWAPAMVAFEQAADEAETTGNATASGRLWVQAGNAALAVNDPTRARGYFDAALARGLPAGMDQGEAHLDRARALVALNELALAREDIDIALQQVPADPLGWLLSATLARRMDNLPLAQRHVAQAVKLAPDDAAVALEQGNIAVLTGYDDVAKIAWERAVKLSPTSVSGKAAAENLVRLGSAGK